MRTVCTVESVKRDWTTMPRDEDVGMELLDLVCAVAAEMSVVS
jgi:hypothetical protein